MEAVKAGNADAKIAHAAADIVAGVRANGGEMIDCVYFKRSGKFGESIVGELRSHMRVSPGARSRRTRASNNICIRVVQQMAFHVIDGLAMSSLTSRQPLQSWPDAGLQCNATSVGIRSFRKSQLSLNVKAFTHWDRHQRPWTKSRQSM
jgi:hypothetical protein